MSRARIDPDVVLWSAPESERADRPLLVMLHGVGSNESDLFSLAPYLPPEPVVASLRAPHTYGPGFAWFPMPEQADDETRWHVARESTRAVLEWLDTVEASRVGLLGFSQGAAMCFELLRAEPERFEFAVPLSGFVIPAEHEGDAALALRRPPVFWGHGSHDPIFTPERLEFSREWLPKHVDLTEREYAGLAHAVNQQEIADIAAFLQNQYSGH